MSFKPPDLAWNLKQNRPDLVTTRQESRSSRNSSQSNYDPIPAILDNGAFSVSSHSLTDWIGQIKKVWTRGAAGTLELARVVADAKSQLLHGQWTEICRSLPFSKRKADMLATVGKAFTRVNEQTFARLPIGWSVLYQLAQLERATFEKFLREGTIHPELTLREARELVRRCKGQPDRLKKIKVKQRLRRFTEFVRSTVSDWKPEERELAGEELSRLVEEIVAGNPMKLCRVHRKEPSLATKRL